MLSLLALASAYGQTGRPEGRNWTLPSSLIVKQNGPQSWRFTVDYNNLDIRGRLVRLQRVSGLYTRGLPGGAVRWNDVTIANHTDGSDRFPTVQKQEFMEGFSGKTELAVSRQRAREVRARLGI